MTKPLSHLDFLALTTNAPTRAAHHACSVAEDVLRLRLTVAAVKLAYATGHKWDEQSPVLQYGEPAALAWTPDHKPHAEMCADALLVLEAAMASLGDYLQAQDTLQEHQAALHRLQLRQAARDK
jgi:hypothetical protein